MMGLQRQSVAEAVDAPAFTGDAAVEEVPRIELQTRLGRENLERATGRRFGDSRRKCESTGRRARTIEHEVVIVSVAVADLRVRSLVDPRSDRRRGAKVEWCAFNACDLARRDQHRIDRSDRIGIDRQHVRKRLAQSEP